MSIEDVKELARTIRAHTLRMVHKAKASHVGTCLSMADLVAALYGRILKVNPLAPHWPERDRFILSKGHGAAIVYAALAERGFFPKKWLETYCEDGSHLSGHIMHGSVPGVEASTGSLGHGLSIGCGMALAAKRAREETRVFVILSDGELDEGSVWEAVLFAPHHRLDNLTAIVDYNKIQSFGSIRDVLELEPLADKWRAFGWVVREINGHDYDEIIDALSHLPLERDKPTAIIAHTIKGKGVTFMENELAWHYKSPDDRQLAEALHELGEDV